MKPKPGLPPLAFALGKARRLANLEQSELGEKVGVSARSVSRWETGHWIPHRTNQAAILAAFAGLPAPVVRELTTLLVGIDPGGPRTEVAPGSPRSIVAEPAVDVKALMDGAVLRAAEELDLGPRKVRAALASVLEAIERAGVAPRAAREAMLAPAAAPKK